MLTEKYFFLGKTQPPMLYIIQGFLTSVIASPAVSSISWQDQKELAHKTSKTYKTKFTILQSNIIK